MVQALRCPEGVHAAKPLLPSRQRRTNRCRVLVWAAAADAAVMAALALVPAFASRSAQVALLYLLLGLQFSAASFYEPGGPGGRGSLPGVGGASACFAWAGLLTRRGGVTWVGQGCSWQTSAPHSKVRCARRWPLPLILATSCQNLSPPGAPSRPLPPHPPAPPNPGLPCSPQGAGACAGPRQRAAPGGHSGLLGLVHHRRRGRLAGRPAGQPAGQAGLLPGGEPRHRRWPA